MEGRLEAVVRPGHQEVADVADDVTRRKIDFRPSVADAEIRDYFSTWTDFQAALAGPLEEEGQEVPACVGAGVVVALFCP